LGEAWLAAGEAARSAELLRDAALMDRSHPEAPRAEFLLACSLTVQGQDASALPLLRRLASERPEDLRAWMRGDSAGVRAVRASSVLAPLLPRKND
jgi:Flp pilus assembly protein TadD